MLKRTLAHSHNCRHVSKKYKSLYMTSFKFHIIILIFTGYFSILCVSRVRPVRRWNRYASVRCCSGSVVIIIIFEGVHGQEYGCSGLDDVLLNHNHYIKAMNVCSAQCSILHISRDIIDLIPDQRLADGNRNTGPRSLIVPGFTYGNGVSWDR